MRNLVSLIPQTLENRAALRSAIATLIAVLLAFKLHLESPYWAGMTVVIIANLYTGNIIDKAILRIIGTIIGAWTGFFLARYIVHSFSLFIFANFLLISISVYFYTFSRYAYAYLLGGLGGLFVVAQLAMIPANAFLVAIWRPVEIGLGVLVAALAASFIFPNKIHDAMKRQIDTIFVSLNHQIKIFHEILAEPEQNLNIISKNNLALKKQLRKASEMLGFLHREAGVKKENVAYFSDLLGLIYELCHSMNYFILTHQNNLTITILSQKSEVQPLFVAMKNDLEKIHQEFSCRSSFDYFETAAAINHYEQYILHNVSPSHISCYQLSHWFKHMNDTVQRIHNLLTQKEQGQPKNIYLKPHHRLSHDSDVLKQGVKVGLSTVLALMFWLYSNWPGGLNGIISSLVISAKKTSTEMKTTAIHRILGCLMGGGAALLSLYYLYLDVYTFSFILFVLVWLFSYYSFKYPPYAYIGLQANIALILTLAQKGGPPNSIDRPLERLGGIAIGICASYLVFNALWRGDSITLLEKRLGKLYHLLSYNLSQILTQKKEDIKLHNLVNLIWACRGLIEELTNEELNKRKQNKLKKLTEVFDKLVLIHATISYILASIEQENARKTAAFFDVNLKTLENQVTKLYQQMNPQESELISQQLLGILDKIYQYVQEINIESKQLINLLAYIQTLFELTNNNALTLIKRSLKLKPGVVPRNTVLGHKSQT